MPAPSENNFAATLEARASEPQDFVCFLDSQTGDSCTYFELRSRGVWLARELEAQGIYRGGVCAVDMDNSPALFYTVVAAAYGGFSLVLLNTRLTEAEKQERVSEIKRILELDFLPTLNETTALALVREAENAGPNGHGVLSQWARRGVGSFDEDSCAFIMFTSGTSGRPKAAELSWQNVLGAARASNEKLNKYHEGIWQLVLPAYHVSGLQIFFRSILNHNAFLLYRNFDAKRILADAKTYGATHISVVDKTLQDLLTLDANPENAAGEIAALSEYECILLGGSRPNTNTLLRALGQQAPVYISYGLTETCSQVANARLVDSEKRAMELLPGYEFTIAAPDASGYGQLGVKGPGIIKAYLNAQAAFTADGYFLTGDRAKEIDGLIEVAERADDMFVSGGENIYPAEIRDKILAFEGVTDAYVFGAPDETWGRRPVAFVEASAGAARPGFNSFYFADDMRNRLSTRLSPVYMPDQFIVMNEFPRSGIGKLSQGTLERMWDARIQVAKVEIWLIRLPFVAPVRTAKTKLRHRDSIILRVSDHAGRTGLGECVAFDTNWYMQETISSDLPLIRDSLAPLLVGRSLLHPSAVTELFENVPGAMDAPLARAALENALWDLYGKIRNRSICQLIGARESVVEAGALDEIPKGCAVGGVVIGIGSVPEVLTAVNTAVQEGYRRVKLKIRPGSDIDIVRAVREAHPDLMLMLDANQSYKDEQLSLLQQLDEFGIECIEEPLDPGHVPSVGPTDLFDRLARLQAQVRMRVCLDESWGSAEELYNILEQHPELRCVALKIGKFGSADAALSFYKWARERGIEAWPGGMYDTGISKRLHAAFGLLPGVNLPGDISSSEKFFTVDICDPPLNLSGGVLLVNDEGHAAGLGCELNEDLLSNVVEKYWVCE